MNDDRWDEHLREAVRDYHRPPEVPRAAMWSRIEAARQSARDSQQMRPRHGFAMPRRVVWGLAAAAALVIGVGIGRYATTPARLPSSSVAARTGAGASGARTPANTSRPASAANAEVNAARGEPDLAYRVATIQHLARTEALLTTVRADARAGRSDASVDAWARDLLGTTRLLLDSPAARDPQLGPLLGDLELVLVQIAALPRTHNRADIHLINQAVQQHAVLTRLQMTIPAGALSAGL
ncbi:MAG TPA: hypothetical protein VFW98_13475 [Gemmatimonadaceae bacterium]|nr:hypothetical protein [Gemmatimonadaceae bacterium]